MVNKTHSTKGKASSDSSTVDPMVKYVSEEFERYEKFHTERFDKAQKFLDAWNNVPPSRAFSWQNAVHVPMTFTGEQTITPRIFAALFPTEAPIDVAIFDEYDPNVTEKSGMLLKHLIQHHFRMSDVQGECMTPLTQNTLLGTGYVESPYLYRTKWIVRPDGQRAKVVTDNRPDCKAVNFFEMFPHPAKLRMDDGLPLIRRRWCDAEYIKSLADNPNIDFESIKSALDSEPVSRISTSILDESGAPMDMKKREEYELLEYWGGWDISYKDDKGVSTKMVVPHWIVVVNRAVKLKGSPNPFNHQQPPYCKFTLYPAAVPCWFGVGMGHAGFPTQDRLNKIVNQRLDNVDLVLNKQGVYNGADPLINVRKLKVSMPGQWHKVSDTVNSIKWMDIPDVTASSYKEEELAKSDFREATGAVVPLMPADEGQHRTAAGINLLQGAAGIRFRPILRKIETDLIQQLAHLYLSNLQQFMLFPEWINITTDAGKEKPTLVTPEDIQRRVKFIPTGISETLSKEVQIGQLLRFKEVTAQDRTINQVALNRRIGELMGFKKLDELTEQPQPIQMGEGQLPPDKQLLIQQRLREGASPAQIKAEMLGNRQGGSAPRVAGQTPEAGAPVQGPRTPA
jgi:hypothetical protein